MNPIVAEIPEGPVTQADLARVEKKLDAALEALKYSTGVRAEMHVLNTQQAMAFVNCRSSSTFHRWINEYAPFSRTKNNRYSRARLEIGRARELNQAGSVK